MTHGGYTRRRVADRRPAGRPAKAPGLNKHSSSSNTSKKKQKQKQKPKSVSLKNQIRSKERMLRKEIPVEIRQAQERRLEELKKQQEVQTRLAVERRIFLKNRKIKFFERRKIERRIRRLEKQQRTPSDQTSEATILEQLSELKENLEYVRFFPKTEKYVPLFVGSDNADIVETRDKLRKQIKDNLIAAAASGKDLEETASDDDEQLDVSEDDFFLTGSSSDEDADDEWTDKSTREPASSTSGKAASGMSSDEKNQRQLSDRARMPPPRPNRNSCSTNGYGQARLTSRSQNKQRAVFSTSSNTSCSRSGTSSRNWGSNTWQDHSSNLSSNSDAHKPRRKRRPKKKKQSKVYALTHSSGQLFGLLQTSGDPSSSSRSQWWPATVHRPLASGS